MKEFKTIISIDPGEKGAMVLMTKELIKEKYTQEETQIYNPLFKTKVIETFSFKDYSFLSDREIIKLSKKDKQLFQLDKQNFTGSISSKNGTNSALESNNENQSNNSSANLLANVNDIEFSFTSKITKFDDSPLIREIYKLLIRWTTEYDIDLIVIEKQNPGIQRSIKTTLNNINDNNNPSSGKGKMGMFKTGIMEGIFLTLPCILNIPFIQIASNSWQKIYKLETILTESEIKEKVSFRKDLAPNKLKVFSWCYSNLDNRSFITSRGAIIDGITDAIGLGNYVLTNILNDK